MDKNWKSLPNEIIDLIIQYDGRIKYRNGVYMNQIDKKDDRYLLLYCISRKEFFETSLNFQREFMFNSKFVRETFVFFRKKRYENNKYFSIYFEEQLDPLPYTITHHFMKTFTNNCSFILP